MFVITEGKDGFAVIAAGNVAKIVVLDNVDIVFFGQFSDSFALFYPCLG